MTADFGAQTTAEKMMKKLAESTKASAANGKPSISSLKIAAQVIAAIPTTGDRAAALRVAAAATKLAKPTAKNDFALGQGEPPPPLAADDEQLNEEENQKNQSRREPKDDDVADEESGGKYDDHDDVDNAQAPIDNDSDVDREYNEAHRKSRADKEVAQWLRLCLLRL